MQKDRGKTRIQCDDNVMLVTSNKGENKTQRDSANQRYIKERLLFT